MVLKQALSAVFVASLVIANITAAKLAFFQVPGLGGVAVPAGFVGLAAAFLASDLVSELYGRDVAHSMVNGAIIALATSWVLVYAAIWMPAAPFYEMQSAYASVLGASGTILLAGLITLSVSQHVDVRVFHYIRQRTEAEYLFARNLGSTAVSQFVDTALFILLGFVLLPAVFGGSVQPLAVALELILAQYVLKLVVALADTPLFYLGTHVAKRVRPGTGVQPVGGD